MKISWEQGRWMPTFVKGGAMGVVDGLPVYAAGVTFPWRETEMSWYWDIARGDWFPVNPPLPLGRAYTQGVTLEDGLLVLGGRKFISGATSSLRDAWWLRRNKKKFYWTQLPDMLYPRATPNIGVYGNKILAFGGGEWEKSQGGAFATRHLTNYEILDLDNLDKGWKDMCSLPFTPLTGSAFASIGGSAYVFGGYECWTEDNRRKIRNYSTAWRYDFGEDEWIQLADLPFMMHAMSAVPYEGWIFLMAGAIKFDLCGLDSCYHTFPYVEKGKPNQRLIGNYSDLVFAYNIGTNSYQILDDRLPVGNADVRATIIGNKIYIAGGETVDPSLSNTSNAFIVGTIHNNS